MHPYVCGTSERFSVCAAMVNCPAAVVTAIVLIGCNHAQEQFAGGGVRSS